MLITKHLDTNASADSSLAFARAELILFWSFGLFAQSQSFAVLSMLALIVSVWVFACRNRVFSLSAFLATSLNFAA